MNQENLSTPDEARHPVEQRRPISVSYDVAKGLTCYDLVAQYFPDISTRDANDILWGETQYPFYRHLDQVRMQLARLKCNQEWMCGGPYKPIGQLVEEEMDRIHAAELKRGDA